jgi:putative oxidoreductase
MKRLINLSFIPLNNDAALLILRVLLGLGLFAKHGIEKFTNFGQMKDHFPDPLHIGSTLGLIWALLADGICSILVILGAGTRLAALVIVINLFIVFAFMHKFSFAGGHAEMVYVYLGGFITVLLAGAGKYSIDNKLV